MGKGIGRIICRLSHDDAITRLEPVVNAFTAETPPIGGPWPTCVPAPAVVKEVFTSFKEVHLATKSGNFAKVAERNALRPVFNETFVDFTDYIELASRKDPSLLFKAGYDYFRKTTAKAPASKNPLSSPENFSTKQGAEKGMVVCSALGVPGAKGYEVQFTESDPLDESAWKHYLAYGGSSKMIVTGLEPGKVYTFRARALRTNEWGPWSHYVTMLVM